MNLFFDLTFIDSLLITVIHTFLLNNCIIKHQFYLSHFSFGIFQ
jgi:hypothetical protein